MSFPKYPKYKPSGVDWLGEVPECWQINPLWTLFRRIKRTGFENEELLSVYRDLGVILKSSRDDNFNKPSEDLSSYQLVEPSDLVINKMKAWQGSVAVSNLRGIVSPAYFVYKGHHKQNSRFLHYLMRSAPFIAGYLALSKGIRINQWDLEPQYHSRMPILLPSECEQHAIASFLDHETAKIDALIAEQQRLIELLKEKRQAVISHAVTKGLDPNVRMKNSGVGWLGEVPEHWEVVRIKNIILSIEQGWSPQCEGDPVQSDDQWGVLKVGCVNYGVFTPEENKILPQSLNPLPELAIRKGDLLISRANSIELVGGAAIADRDYSKLLLCDKLYRLRFDDSNYLPQFVCFFLLSNFAREQIELGASGASPSMKNISQSVILDMPLAMPCRKEQDKIVFEINVKISDLDLLVEKARQAVRLFQERRNSLISAAVTGKIDVRGFQPVAS